MEPARRPAGRPWTGAQPRILAVAREASGASCALACTITTSGSVNRVKDRLEAGETVFGTWLQSASPTVANILSHSGMDFVTVDMEHGPASFSEAESIMYAVEAGGSTPMIRLGDGSAPNILKACDVGCQGILVAHVQTPRKRQG